MDPEGQSRSSALAWGGSSCTPRARHDTPWGHRDSRLVPKSPHHRLPLALTGEVGLAPRGQAAARSSPVKRRGLRSWGPPQWCPHLAVGWGPRSGDIIALPPPAHSLDASAVLEVGQVAADGAEAGQDLGGEARGAWGRADPPGTPTPVLGAGRVPSRAGHSGGTYLRKGCDDHVFSMPAGAQGA